MFQNTGRPRKPNELTATGMWAGGLYDDKARAVIYEARAEGIEAVRNRRLWIRLGLVHLSRLLGAIPARVVPDDVRPHMAVVRAWLEGKHT